MAKVEWTEDAIEDLSRLDKPIIRRILKKVSWFSNNFDSISHLAYWHNYGEMIL